MINEAVSSATRPRRVAPRELERHISLGAAVMLVVGNVIGSGIFLTSGLMLNHLSTGGELIMLWTLGGLLSICGGLTIAELGVMFPVSGGSYVYLAEAYGPRFAFLFGWTSLTVILTGQIAGIAIGFAEYLAYFVPEVSPSHQLWAIRLSGAVWEISSGQLVAIASILALGVLNSLRLQGGRNTAVILTVVKITALAALAVALLAGSHGLEHTVWRPHADISRLPAMGLAMIPVLYTYEGWANLAYIAGEVRDPSRNIPRAFVLGIGLVTILYLLVNLAYLSARPVDELRGVARVAEIAASAVSGPLGGRAVAAMAILSTLGCNAAMIFVSARLFFAMSRRGALFSGLGEVDARHGTPARAVLLVTLWSAALALSGTYEQLYTLVTFAVLLFAAAVGSVIFVLRWREPARPRSFRAWGYPTIPALFVLAMAGLAINTLFERPLTALVGLGLVALGLPLYEVMRRSRRAASFGRTVEHADSMRTEPGSAGQIR